MKGKLWVPTAKIETLSTKKRRLLVINKTGRVYDIAAGLRRTLRDVERGGENPVTDVVLITRHQNGQIESFALGQGPRERSHWMVSTVKNRLEPA